MPDNDDLIKPLVEINFFGKEGTKHPFQLTRFKRAGLFYYIFTKDLQQLLHINKKYESIKKPEHGTEPLQEVYLVGAGNIVGYKPFVYRGELSICILADHLHQLMKINKEYREIRKRIRKEHKPEKVIEAQKPKKVVVHSTEKMEKPKEPLKLTGGGLKINKRAKLRKKKVKRKITKSEAKRVEHKKKFARKAKKPKLRKPVKHKIESKKPKVIKKVKISKRKTKKGVAKFKAKPKKKMAKKVKRPKPRKTVKHRRHANIAKSKGVKKLKRVKLKKKRTVKRRATKPHEHKLIKHAKLLRHHLKRIFRT